MYFKIRKFDYLKTPKLECTFHNDQGGSFSNSGQLVSLKAIARHIWGTYRNIAADAPSTRVVIEHWLGFDDNDRPVTSTELTDVDALLSRVGVTRNA